MGLNTKWIKNGSLIVWRLVTHHDSVPTINLVCIKVPKAVYKTQVNPVQSILK